MEYKLSLIEKKDSFYNNFFIPSYFGVLVLVMIFSLLYFYMIPDRVTLFYFFYILSIALRSASAINLFILEDYLPIFNKIGYISGFSLLFAFLSFIFYILFIRGFTEYWRRQPKLDHFFKAQIVFLICFIIFDLLYPVAKYTNPRLYGIFRALEIIGTVGGVISIFLLIKIYDRQNRYIIWGASLLIVIALIGQEIMIRFFITSRESNETSINIIWTIAYLVEIFFFSLALFSRQKVLLQKLNTSEQQIEKLKDSFPINTKVEFEKLSGYESLSISSLKGTILLPQEDIVRLEASGSYTIFHYLTQKQTVASYTMSDFEPKLHPDRFMRVHKSHIVNLNFIAKYTRGDGGIITLKDGTEVPVSRSRKEELLHWLDTLK